MDSVILRREGERLKSKKADMDRPLHLVTATEDAVQISESTFIDILRYGLGWLIAVVGALWGYFKLQHKNEDNTKALDEHKKSSRENMDRLQKDLIEKIDDVAQDFLDFKNGDYKDDRREVLEALKRVESSQLNAEKRIEEKIDRNQASFELKFDKLIDQLTSANLTLAEMRARLNNNSHKGPQNSNNPI